jgi:hypothetical protein
MLTNTVLVNDKIRIKVKFVDVNNLTGEQILVSPTSVLVAIYKSDNTEIVSTSATSLTSSEYYYDFTPTVADTYKIVFIGNIPGGSSITVNQQLYVSTSTDEYKPKITLKADEIITFAPDVDPIYLNPEEMQAYFPEASLLEIGEIIHFHSMEVRDIYGFNDFYSASNINYTSLEYIKAATACDLSRTYSYGGDDDVSVQLGDLTVTARNLPRTNISRGNAVTWCQIAAALRKEMLAGITGARGVQPKGIPTLPIVNAGKYIDPDTGRVTYLTERDIYGASRKKELSYDPMPKRGLHNYD